ncbi:MAG: single-stranded-DNA-specific exonuclease [Parcubacteria group bacterium Licking1014_1]|nr:MAG: single-stranded-DNA-specific exonuclease [Parcubacteria group bacterium Licking1014_1]
MLSKIKNIEKAAERIKKAVQNKERIILYGDSDLDGISSVVILEEAINNLGGKIDSAFFPDRENDGYGVNMKALNILKDKAPALFITLDLGIGNLKEVKTAKEMGFEVIIIDHHEILHSMPDTPIIVDPKQKEDSYYFKELANVGITFKLCEEILGDKISKNLRDSFLELAALGTIADMVSQVDDNEKIIEQGLRSLKNTFRPGLRAFLSFLGQGYVFKNSVQKIISALNAAESKNYQNDSYLLLTCPLAEKCDKMVQDLLSKNKHKQQKIKEIIQETERRVSRNPEAPIIFEGDSAWNLTLAGSVASVISQRYGKPTFIFKKMDSESCGSVRNPKDTNSVEAMKTCSDFLISYGGHAQASGFRVKNEHLDKFKECLNEYFKK